MPREKEKSKIAVYQGQCKTAYDSFKRKRDLEKQVPNTVWGYKLLLPEKPKTYTTIPNFGKGLSKRKFPYYEKNFVQLVDSLEIDGEIELTQDLRNVLSLQQSKKKRITKREFLDIEQDRWTNGFWWYNKNNLEYITGYHYLILQYWLIPVDKSGGITTNPLFVDMQRDRHYCASFTIDDPDLSGICYIGKRREGKTVDAGGTCYFHTFFQYNGFCSIQSKTDDDAEGVFRKVISSWRHLPKYLKPDDSGVSNPKSELLAAPPSTRSTKGEKKTYNEYLNSIMRTFNSKAEAVDGQRTTAQISDEFGKTVSAKVTERQNINKICCTVGSKIIGFQYWTTTVEEMEKKGGAEAFALWEGADPDNLTENGRTQNLLARLFFPAYYGMYEGVNLKTGKPLVDDFGYSDIKGAIEYLNSEEKGKSKSDLEDYRRKFPRSIEDVFKSLKSQTPFNVEYLEQDEKQVGVYREQKKIQTVRGNLEWVDGIPFKDVYFKPSENGLWEVLEEPAHWVRNKRGNKKYGVKETPFSNAYISSLDPYAWSQVSDEKRASKAASQVMGLWGDLLIPTVVCEYHGRPNNVTKMYEDILKQLIWYSSPLSLEKNTHGFEEYAANHGYDEYIMPNPFHKGKGIERGIPNKSAGMRETLVNQAVAYVDKYIGLKEEEGFKTHLVFDKTRDDLKSFDVEKWTKFDLAVSFMYLIVGWNYRDQYYKLNKKDEKKFNKSFIPHKTKSGWNKNNSRWF